MRAKPAGGIERTALAYTESPPGSALTFTHKCARWTPWVVGAQERC
jgi:hypothetical protein